MITSLSDIVLNGSLLISAPLAVLAGLVSFLSPCVLPLVPGYLGFVSGTASSDRTRSRMVLGSSLFVLGFTLVFVVFGALLGSLGTVLLFQGRAILQPIAGVLVIALGFVLIGQFSFLQKTIKPNFTPKAGLAFAPLLGIVFGLGWTPCIGPTLGGVLSMVLTQGGLVTGVILATLYSIGLGLPFVLLAAGFSWASASVGFVRKNIRKFNIAGGILLIVLGVLLATGVWNIVAGLIQELFSGFVPAL